MKASTVLPVLTGVVSLILTIIYAYRGDIGAASGWFCSTHANFNLSLHAGGLIR